MKRNISLITVLILTISIIKAAPINGSAFLVTEPLLKQWKIASVVADGVEIAPDATMSGDILNINADNTIETILSGVVLNGTYALGQSNTLLTITSEDLTTHLRLKIILVTDTQLQIQRVDSEGVVTTINFIPA